MYEKYLKSLLNKPHGILTVEESILIRIYIDWKDREEKDNILLLGFIDIERLIDIIIPKEILEDFR